MIQIESGDLWVSDGKFLDAEAYFYSKTHYKNMIPDVVIDAKNMIVSPGFIDIQINGGYGVDFSDPTLTADQVTHVTRSLLAVGLEG